MENLTWLNIRMQPKLKRRLRVAAALDEVSVSEYTRKLIAQALTEEIPGIREPYEE